MAETLYGGKRWQQILDETKASIDKLCETKGAEYAASNKDQLANFRRRSGRFELPVEASWAIYAGKHWDAIETYVTDLIHGRERKRSEPIDGRVDDLIVYLIVFKAMLAERVEPKIKVEFLTGEARVDWRKETLREPPYDPRAPLVPDSTYCIVCDKHNDTRCYLSECKHKGKDDVT